MSIYRDLNGEIQCCTVEPNWKEIALTLSKRIISMGGKPPKTPQEIQEWEDDFREFLIWKDKFKKGIVNE